MWLYWVIIAGCVFAVLLCLFLVWLVPLFSFVPSEDKAAQLSQLNKVLAPFGFVYDSKQDLFYTPLHCWQRGMGYCRAYDEGAPAFNMVFDCEPIEFAYGGRRWLVELWKGQYGITTGAEIGIYQTSCKNVKTSEFSGAFYESIYDDELVSLSFSLYKHGKIIMRRNAVHWWLTGFILGEFSSPETLTMIAKIRFNNVDMCGAFVNALQKLGYPPQQYSVHGQTVKLLFDRPYSEQPQNKLQTAAVQLANEANCKAYQLATASQRTTLDKLELISAAAPDLYQYLLKGIYPKEVYQVYDSILKELPHCNRSNGGRT